MNRTGNSGPPRVRGFTLVEMMVAITVGAILLAGVIQLFASNKQAYRIQEGASVMNENARYALTMLQYDLRMADHWGGVQPELVSVDTTGAAIAFTNDCAEAPILRDPGMIGFEGFEGAAAPPVSCIPAADYEAGTDVLVIRYAGPRRENEDDNTEPLAQATIKADSGLFVRTAMGRRAVIYEGVDVDSLDADMVTPTATEPQFADYRFNTIVYFIRSCASQSLAGSATRCDAGDDGIPTLARLVLQDRTLVQEEVVSGVEQFQLTYGIDRDGDLVADQYEDAVTIRNAGVWGDVVDLRISMVLRNDERDVTAPPTAVTYNLVGGEDYTPPLAEREFRRKTFNFVVQVRNQTRS